jgi:hypothetical protein
MEDLEPGSVHALPPKDSELLKGLEIVLRGAMCSYITQHRAAFSTMAGGGDNGVMTVMGKMYCDFVAVGALITGTPITKVKSGLIALMSKEIDVCFEHHQKLMREEAH